MLTTRVIPCLLLKDGGLVKTVNFKNAQYVGDPINVVRIFNELEVDELAFLDISASVQQYEPPFEIIGQIASECFMPIAYGGGIKDIDTVKKIFSIGVEKVIINSHAALNPDFISKAAAQFGSQSIVVSIDCKKTFLGGERVFSHAGSKNTKRDPVDYAKQMEKAGAGEILLTSIDHEGTWQGFHLDLIRRVTQAVNIPVIAHGGAGSVEHLTQAVKQSDASAVALGSMVVFQGKDLGVLVNFPSSKDLNEAFQ